MPLKWNAFFVFISILSLACSTSRESLVDGDWVIMNDGNVLEVINSSASGFELAVPKAEGSPKASFKITGHWGAKEFFISPAKNNQRDPEIAKRKDGGYTIVIERNGKEVIKQLEKVVKKTFENSVLSSRYKNILLRYPNITIVGESPSFYVVQFPEPSEGILYMGAVKEE